MLLICLHVMAFVRPNKRYVDVIRNKKVESAAIAD